MKRLRKPAEDLTRYRVSYVFTVTGHIDVDAINDRQARAIFAKWGTMTRLSRGGEWTVKVADVSTVSDDQLQAEQEQRAARWKQYIQSLREKKASGRRLSLIDRMRLLSAEDKEEEQHGKEEPSN